MSRQSHGVPGRRPVAGVVGIVRDADSADFLRQERVEQFVGEALRAVDERHVLEAVHPEGQRVEGRFAQDHFRPSQGRASTFQMPSCGPGR